MSEIGIVEAKNIIKTINDGFGIDFSDYALTSFKRRLEKVMDVYNLKYIDLLVNKFHDDAGFIDQFLQEISVPTTEMFRDPSLWRLMREELIPRLYSENGSSFKIWLPCSTSGDELFSLAIMLKELNLLDKVSIVVSSICERSLEIIKSGILTPSKVEISSDNYIRAYGEHQLAHYIEIKDNLYYRDTSLIKNVTFFKQDLFCNPFPQGIKLVLLRNKMIYFNQVLQWKVVKNIYQALNPGGLFIIGIQESLGQLYGLNEFSIFNENECIYKRK
jgi:chemotaxis protein methyltransferase CheR